MIHRPFTFLTGASRGRRFSWLAALAAAAMLLCLACVSAQDQDSEAAQTELKQGKYSAAIASFTKLLQADPKDADAQKGLLTAYLETGQYKEAEREARKFLAAAEAPLSTRLLLGEVLAISGRYNEAIAEFARAEKAEETAVKIRAMLRRGEILKLTGQEEAAQQLFQALVTFYEDNTVDEAGDLAVIAKALAHLEKYQEANDLYLDAIARDEESIEAQLGGGELYTSKYNYADAAQFFTDALKINEHSARAHLGVAANKRIEGGDQMNAALAQALKINPNYVEAKTLAAALDLEAERYGSARTQIEEALRINPQALDAHALRAAMFWLQDQPVEYNREMQATLAINPRYGMLYEVLAHFATQTRRYREAVGFLRQAVQISPRLWSSHLALGIGLLRLGQMEEGRAAIETSFQGDAFNIWAKNTLDLLDTMNDYRVLRSGDFIIKAAPQESDILFGYAAELLDEVRGTLTAKYKFTPQAPISVEIFPNHDDFAVRTLGLPGLGALGVCFGQVIAQDSPSARAGSPFNWGSTLWHEYTHVITLQITDHLIPRWFSEGLSVYEEHKARPGWGDDWNPESLRAFAEGKWFKIADLDNGFIRPKRPQDVALAYFQASQICHFVEERYGFQSILDMLRGYREKKKTPAIVQEVLKLTEADFDREFTQYVRNKVEKQLKALESAWKPRPEQPPSKEETIAQATAQPDDYLLNLRAGLALFGDKNYDQAVTYLRRAVSLYPFQTGSGNPYEILARIYEEKGDKAQAAEMLEAWIKVDENHYDALKKLAQLKAEAGDKARALELLRLSFYVNPFEHAAHTQAGELHLDLGQPDRAIREFQAALANKPPNVAEAHYHLARAYLAAGKKPEAKRSVLRALEAAPGFDKAQDLLLELTGQKP